MKTLNTSLKHHAIIGALLSVWGFLFAFFSRPFEHGEMDFQKWLFVSLGFSVLVFVAYLIVSWIQRWVYKISSSWSIIKEVGMYLLFFTIYAIFTYVYYKSSVINGFYNFPEFLEKIILNIALIITPILFIARRYFANLLSAKDGIITIKGENKLDILKINRSDLICISNAQNYVEIFFIDNDKLSTKLIRTSMKQIQADFDFLIRIHRSHLINPKHFRSWVDNSTISLTHIELPVSKNYKKALLAL